MINSLFMLGGAYNKDRKISFLFITGWILHMLVNYNFSLGLTFPVINAIVCLIIAVSINLVKNKTLNTVLSITSILIWSVIIDTICFFMYPMMVGEQSNILYYIFQGILFNYKYIFVNALAILFINCIIFIKNSILKEDANEAYNKC